MKKLLLLILCAFLIAPVIKSQNMITGGNMEDEASWNFYWGTNGNDTGVYEFNYTGDVPAAGDGGCYRVTARKTAASFIWQPVTIIPGHRYTLTGAYKYIGDTAVNTWLEYFLTRVKPTGGDVSTAQGWSVNTWMHRTGQTANNPDTVMFDGTFEDNFARWPTSRTSNLIEIPDSVTQTEWYVVLKAGCWNTLKDTNYYYDVLFDELDMTDMGAPTETVLPIANIVFGTVDSPQDYTGQVTMKWDADSVYMVYDVVDDSIVNMGANYQVDNLEIYFDMDNSKTPHYPRNGGWMANIDAAYDTNDFQLRLVPDVPFGTNNHARPASASILDTTARQVYTRTADGYQFVLNVAWDALLNGFEASPGTEIGFDVLLSDNDAVASNPNRNQITWNSPTDKPFNDPSQFGTLVLADGGYFWSKPDLEKPTAPENLVGTMDGTDVVLTWDPSTDNIVVQSYVIFQGSAQDTVIYAKLTGNTFKVIGLTAGETYKFSVLAMDLYGNKSAKTTTDDILIPTNVKEQTESHMMVYPNPSNGLFTIVSEGTATVSLEVYNLTGGLVASSVFTQNTRLDLSKYSKGVYFLHLSADGKTQVTKLIVR